MLLSKIEAETTQCCEDQKLCCISTRCMGWQWADHMMDFGFCGKAGIPLELDEPDNDDDDDRPDNEKEIL